MFTKSLIRFKLSMNQLIKKSFRKSRAILSGLPLQQYFSGFAVNNLSWVFNPFGSNESTNLSVEEEQVVDLQNASFFRTLPPPKILDELWLSPCKFYSTIGAKAIKTLFPFASWLCEHSCSVLSRLKSSTQEKVSGTGD